MQGQNSWVGIECEGRLSGLKTFFIRHHYEVVPSDCAHVYFTREYLQSNANVEFLEEFILQTNKIVTIECNNESFKKLTPNMRVRAHIIYRIEDENAHKLKSTDEIMLDTDVYQVICFTKHSGHHVKHENYANDILVKGKNDYC